MYDPYVLCITHPYWNVNASARISEINLDFLIQKCLIIGFNHSLPPYKSSTVRWGWKFLVSLLDKT